MIKTREELKYYIEKDNIFHWEKKSKWISIFLRQDEFYYIRKYLLFLRKQEYYLNNIYRNKCNILFYYFYTARKNRLGNKINLVIPPNCLGIGITICHTNIVINPNSFVGEYSILHGNNCIGNNGISDKAPNIGAYANIGYGACIIGDIHIANNVFVGANAVVNKSFEKTNSTILGVPASYKEEKNEI